MKRKTRKWIPAAAAFLAALSLAACGGSGEPAADSVSASVEEVKGVIKNAGEVSALCPNGWESIGSPDLSADDPESYYTDTLRLVKGGSTQKDLLTHAFMEIRKYNSEGDIPEIDTGSAYSEVSGIGDFTTGEHTWSGYSGRSLGKSFIYLESAEKNAAYTVYLYTQDGTENAVSMYDPEVQAILSSIGLPE